MTATLKTMSAIALLLIGMTTQAATCEEQAQINLIGVCKAVTMTDGELRSCTNGMVVEVLATIGVR